MPLKEDIAQSREFEMRTYLDSMKCMYANALLQNGEIYDIAFEHTKGFSRIDGQSILKDSRIIKMLRYAVAPSISQMKFGQFFGLNSVDKFENSKIVFGTKKYKELQSISKQMSDFVSQNLDSSRFIWIQEASTNISLAHEFAKKWTCSIAADQNAQTAYRNWRRDQQEHAIISKLIMNGYTKSEYSGIISNSTDIGIGEYTREIKIKGRTIQKADVAFRSKKDGNKLVLVEAKTVGVELDATKRIKECCDKVNDWTVMKNLQAPIVVAVIAGFFTENNIANLEASGISVVWEHNLKDMDALS
ncbi:MAG: XamI family restriction endonuclease [Humidesulfovibrio sp.]